MENGKSSAFCLLLSVPCLRIYGNGDDVRQLAVILIVPFQSDTLSGPEEGV